MIEIKDESADGVARHQLYVDGCRRCHVTRKKDGYVRLHWDIAGPMLWPEAKEVMGGLLELSLIADQLTAEVENNGKSRRKTKTD